ncbi:MAG: hypothetical protein LBF74_00810, partial [Treponema sp.]|nr:hypothetical protein [Treponema sp.]
MKEVFMKENKFLTGGMLAGLLAGILAGCEWTPVNTDGETMQSAIPLALNTWADGELAAGGKQWFKFTATAGSQYIHVAYGTFQDVYVQLYDRAGSEVGSPYTFEPNGGYTGLSVTKGRVYYLMASSSSGGTYKIAFTESAEVTPDIAAEMASAAALAAGVWARNDLAAGGRQWFKFTATAETLYIHVVYGTLRDMYVQLHDNAGRKMGDPYAFNQNGDYASLLVDRGNEYYLEVWPGSGRGSYKIAFNT